MLSGLKRNMFEEKFFFMPPFELQLYVPSYTYIYPKFEIFTKKNSFF